MIKNNIKLYRAQKSLTQRQLADLSETSQQQIQRIEAGVQAARIELAARIAGALGVTVGQLFPETRKVKLAEGKELSQRAISELEAGGVDFDPRQYRIQIQLRGGLRKVFWLSGTEMRRVRNSLQDRRSSVSHFVIFDSPHERVALNLAHLAYCQFLWEPSTVSEDEPGEDNEIRFWFRDGPPASFAVEPDQDDEDEAGNLGGVFVDLEMASGEPDEQIWFTDEDGEQALVFSSDIILVTAPLPYVEPALFAAEMDGYLEDEGVD